LWNPPNGFDHVAFTIYIELPGRDGGATVMPLQNASLPGGMRWHVRLRAGGWSNALFSAVGAAATREGTPLTPGAALQVDRAARTVTFTLPAAALGRLPSLSGARVYVTTWDYDGAYRALAPQAQPFAIGGGAADGPKVMDDSGIITLP
jgi:carbohydrate-binding DOMON domain-containing protein